MSHPSFKSLFLAALLAALLPVLAMAGPPPQQATVHPMVWEALQAGGETEVLVVLRAQADLSGAGALRSKEAKGRYVYSALQEVASRTQKGLRATLDAQGIEYRSFYIVNALQLRAGNARVRALSARSEVARIVPNPAVQGIPTAPPGADPAMRWQTAGTGPQGVEPNLVRVNADDVWALGYTGQGVVVAGQDTGYDWDHPALKAQYRGWNGTGAEHDFNWHDAIHSGGGRCGPDAVEPCDDHGHGTHTMGTVVGDDGGSNQIGMAPEARWIGCRNMDETVGTPATYMECFEFFLAPYPVDGTPAEGDPDRAPHVVNNSWSCPSDEGCDRQTLEASVAALRQAGIVVVVSGGNSGSRCGSVREPPALYQQSLSVGAMDHRSDWIASFSSRGPVSYGGETYLKPDIAAPGVGIRSSVPGGGYAYFSGTSMAAPHVAGAVALLVSAVPSFGGRVHTIERVLTETAESKLDDQCGEPGPPNSVWGWGVLDTLAAVTAPRLYLPLIARAP